MFGRSLLAIPMIFRMQHGVTSDGMQPGAPNAPKAWVYGNTYALRDAKGCLRETYVFQLVLNNLFFVSKLKKY